MTKLQPHTPAPAPISVFAVPNPFNPSTDIHYSLPRAGHTLVQVFDLKGQLVQRLVSEVQAGGDQMTHWDGTTEGGARAASGIYLVRVQAPSFNQATRITLVK